MNSGARFDDCDGSGLEVGDEVTVFHARRNRPTDASHGVIEKFGSKLVHVRITAGEQRDMDGSLFTYEPEELRKGHHGFPLRGEGAHSTLMEQLVLTMREPLERVVRTALGRKLISQDQADRLEALYDEFYPSPRGGPSGADRSLEQVLKSSRIRTVEE